MIYHIVNSRLDTLHRREQVKAQLPDGPVEILFEDEMWRSWVKSPICKKLCSAGSHDIFYAYGLETVRTAFKNVDQFLLLMAAQRTKIYLVKDGKLVRDILEDLISIDNRTYKSYLKRHPEILHTYIYRLGISEELCARLMRVRVSDIFKILADGGNNA